MSKDNYQISLKALLKNNKGEILALKGHPSGTFAEFYDLPGGRIEVNEFETPFPKILDREIKEELGNNIKYKLKNPVAIGRHLIDHKKFTHYPKDVRILYILFEAEYLRGDIKLSDEHGDGYIWLDIKKNNPEKFFKSGVLEALKMYLKK